MSTLLFEKRDESPPAWGCVFRSVRLSFRSYHGVVSFRGDRLDKIQDEPDEKAKKRLHISTTVSILMRLGGDGNPGWLWSLPTNHA